jgi:hypothetical protein
MQSPRRPLDFSTNQLTRLREQLGESDDYQITSAPRWQNVYYWARALGFCGFVGLSNKTLVIPDPTIVLRRHLREVLLHTDELRIAEMLGKLADRCPVFEGGTLRNEVEERVLTKPRDESRLSESTSLALTRLQDQGLIRLRALADAEVRILDHGDTTERISHVAPTKKL